MSDNLELTAAITTDEPEIAATLDELRYLVFKGKQGDSAYDIAVQLGFEGTEAEWLASLKGETGANGRDGQDGAPGAPGTPGRDGVSPTVQTSTITGGNRVTITDAEHPQGQTFDVMDGDDYALTDADKREIAADAANTVISEPEFGEQISQAVDNYLDAESMPKAQYTGLIIPLAYDAENPIAKVTSADALTFVGENLLDVSTKVSGKIKNDSGAEVSDQYSYYYGQYIPVHGKTLSANFRVQRLYYYDENRQLLSRPTGSAAGTTFTFPDNVYFVQVQVDTRQTTDVGVNMDEACVHYGSGLPDYTPFKSSGTYDGFTEDVSVFGDGVHDVTITVYSSSVFGERVLEVLSSAVDDTLTIPGDAADAAATGARLSELQSSIDDLGGMILDKQSYSGSIITLSAEQTENAVRIESEDDVTFVGENIFDISTAVPGKILNNSGVETADPASYYCTQMIPVHGKTVKSNNKIQRFYYYDENRQFLQRSNGYGENKEISFPSNVYFVQIQIEKRYEIENKCVIYGGGTPVYTPFRQSDTFSGFDGGVSVFGDGVNPVTITVYNAPEKEDEQPIPEIETYPFWEPETVTDAYKCTPLGTYTQSIPALTDTLKYQGFLETYFDVYLGTNADGYTVSREDLGLDSGAAATDHIASPVYSYTFAPKRYKKTILLSAGMNTNEASTYFGLAYFIQALMEHTEPGMLALYRSTRFVVIPVLCPSGIAHDPLLYHNSNRVRINKNFEYYGSWERLKSDSGGAYPDSEVETRMLKYWLNKYAGASFWLDCHSDAGSQSVRLHLGSGFCSDSQTAQKLNASKQDVVAFYRNKGYFGSSDTPSFGWGTQDKGTAIYPKTVYAREVTNIPACMFEQFLYTTAWGSDGATNNDAYGIKHYAAMIRYMVLIMAK